MTTILIAIALCSSLIGLGLSLFALAAMRRSSTRLLSRQLGELSEAQEALNLQVRSLKVRVSALSRPRKSGKFVESGEPERDDDGLPDPQKSALAWKREMNLKLALGKIKP